jgi:hypothetical protein
LVAIRAAEASTAAYDGLVLNIAHPHHWGSPVARKRSVKSACRRSRIEAMMEDGRDSKRSVH